MSPVNAAMKAALSRGLMSPPKNKRPEIGAITVDDVRAIINAFLDAAFEDRDVAEGVWESAYNSWAEFGALDRDAGQAAILALKDAAA